MFQAAQGLPAELRERYFGGDGSRALRGMRNRLAHNDLDIDENVLWESVAVDLREVRPRLADDAASARVLAPLTPDDTADPDANPNRSLSPAG
ncbi:HepT-like ribonuclease domain-containing protein [Occultella glacieicola]|uniref:HepT-like ribonuclease domain-containing protein n=1 Tax=Occultella glacieicola TaxID=2518684 RepID=UPI001F38D49D|nr:HepT-like ribonuclease domain-containing protein [Occultella glacieicola]